MANKTGEEKNGFIKTYYMDSKEIKNREKGNKEKIGLI